MSWWWAGAIGAAR
ncbi:hypothetical protein CISIN_1g0159922mg, partial [Citrus sinensis]